MTKLHDFTPSQPPGKPPGVPILNETHRMTNLFANIPPDLPVELFETLIEQPNVRVERILSKGHASPDGFWFDQDQHEWVLVLKGAAKLELADQMIELQPGDSIDIPAHTKHRVAWTTPDEPTIWLAVW
jgi:cupin 2 domain-containing protein